MTLTNELRVLVLRLSRCTLFVAPLLLGCAAAAPPAETAPPQPAAVASALLPMLEAKSSTGATVYLLGSVHVADPSFYPLDPAIERAYEASEALVVEADISTVDPLSMMKLVVRHAGLPQGVTLEQRVSPQAYASLTRFLGERGVPLANVSGFAPWWVAMNVAMLRLKEQGLTGENGIDMHLLGRSHAAARPVLELESVEGQLALLGSLPADVQELMLLDALVGGLQSGGDMQQILAAWKAGDLAAIERLAFADLDSKPALAPLKQALFTTRNLAMAAKIDELAATRKTLFVVVGAGHVVGEDGVAALLARKGYVVRQREKSSAIAETP